MTRWVQLTGLTPYPDAHLLQQRLVAARAEGQVPDVVLLLEHSPVITLGRAAGSERSVLDPGEWPVLAVERGGNATWHGPGQLVAYPLKRLEGPWCDLHRVLRAQEQAVITCLRDLGLTGGRDPRNTGVWLDCSDGERRKVASVGIACRRWVTWHGLALNVNPDPAAFHRLRPCGLEVGVMTRLADHGVSVPASGLVPSLAAHLANELELGKVELERFSSVADVHLALFGAPPSLDSPKATA